MKKKYDFLLKAGIVLVAIFAIVMFLLLRIEINKLKTERDALASEMSSYSERIDALEKEIGEK